MTVIKYVFIDLPIPLFLTFDPQMSYFISLHNFQRALILGLGHEPSDLGLVTGSLVFIPAQIHVIASQTALRMISKTRNKTNSLILSQTHFAVTSRRRFSHK